VSYEPEIIIVYYRNGNPTRCLLSLSCRLAPEVAHVRPYWSYLGGASGAALGFIVGNAPGAVAGGLAGNRLGAVRDAKGKSVAEVFTSLDAGSKAEVGLFVVVIDKVRY
jgi:hypothetical protein